MKDNCIEEGWSASGGRACIPGESSGELVVEGGMKLGHWSTKGGN